MTRFFAEKSPPPAEGAPILSVEGLSLRLGGTPILHDVALSLGPGEVLGLVGASGSGKSMTALAAMGLLPAGAVAGGAVRLGGHDMLSLPERARNALRGRAAGMIFQEPMAALNPLMTIGAQVAETLIVHGAARPRAARAIAAERLARVGLAPDRISPGLYPHELSGGQRQRVCIAMAIALRPRLLIADEPTTALDVTTQARILDLLAGLVAEEGMALLLITHDLAVAARMATRLAVMEAGRIVEAGPCRALLQAPAHPATQTLLAAARSAPAPPPPAPPGAPLLQVREAQRIYTPPRRGLAARRPAPVAALRGVSLTIRAGESLGLVGASGCGKSTLARAILGLEPLDGGAITLAGTPVSPAMPAPARGRMQAVFQDPYTSFNPRHRVARLIGEPFHLAGRPADAPARIDQALRDVGLAPEDGARFIHAFSGGQRQRIALARALITRPDLIVLDEAISSLDLPVRARILALLARLRARHGLSYLFISHDLHAVRAITDRVAVMQEGQIVEEGATEAVLAAPRHPYTSALLAAAPVLPG